MRYLDSSSRSVSYFNINILQTINKAAVTQLSFPPKSTTGERSNIIFINKADSKVSLKVSVTQCYDKI